MHRWTLFAALMLTGCPDGGSDVDDTATDTDTSETDDLDGASLFTNNCSACHGSDGTNGTVGPQLDHALDEMTDEQVIHIVLNGEDGMPAVDVTEDEAQAIVDYLRDLYDL